MDTPERGCQVNTNLEQSRSQTWLPGQRERHRSGDLRRKTSRSYHFHVEKYGVRLMTGEHATSLYDLGSWDM
jgi:hypothetical protein